MQHSTQTHTHNKTETGFTLIELLVVIGAIGLIAAIALVNLSSAKDKSRTAKAQSDLNQIFKAAEQISTDTGKWPGGCTIGATSSALIQLESPGSGLTAQPSPGTTQSPCSWSAGDLAGWRGPYVSTGGLIDPWGNSYYFDASYTQGSQTFAALVSWGPDKQINTPNADDFVIRLR